MKATIDIPNCIHLHACNRFRVIAQKRGATGNMKCDPLTCTAYDGKDYYVPDPVKKALFSEVMQISPIFYFYIKDARFQRVSTRHETHYQIVIDDERHFKAAAATEKNLDILRAAARKAGIDHLDIIHDEFIGVYDSQIDEMEEGNNEED